MSTWRKAVPYVAHGLAFAVSFIFFIPTVFPYDVIKDREIAKFNARQKPGQRLQVGSISGYWFSGVELRNVSFTLPSASPTQAASELKASAVRARFQILPLFLLRRAVKVSAEAMGGTLEAKYVKSSSDSNIELHVKDLDASEVGPLKDLFGGLPIAGKVSADAELQLPENKISKANGTLQVELTDMVLGDDKAMVQGFAVPKVGMGTTTISAEVKEGTAKIARFATGGRDLDLQGEGKVRLADGSAADATIDLTLRFKFTDALRKRNEKTQNLFGAPGGGTPGAIEYVPILKVSKTAEGYYGWSARGSLQNPQFLPNQLADASLSKKGTK